MLNLFRIRDNKALQISFAWLFAIIVGGFILFLAIFVTMEIFETEQTTAGAKTAKEIGILLNPLETGFETGRIMMLGFPIETRIFNKCDSERGVFGKQLLEVSQKSFNKWSKTDIDVGFANKYIFSENYVEGEDFYLFSKPFEFPFKITDFIFLLGSQERYCFINAPEEIEEEIVLLDQENLLVKDCSNIEDVIKVCFKGSGCEVEVDLGNKRVKKGTKVMYFEENALMYAAIFSDPEIYECQLKRTIKRAKELSRIYRDKSIFISRIGCNSNLDSDLVLFENVLNEFKSSANLGYVARISEDIKNKNDFNQCRLW
jgi:hypothetical protein